MFIVARGVVTVVACILEFGLSMEAMALSLLKIDPTPVIWLADYCK